MSRDAAYQLGTFAGSLLPLAIGIGISFYLRRKREQDHLPGWPIAIGAILGFLGCVSQPAGAHGVSGFGNEQQSAASNGTHPVLGEPAHG